ncbi:MAG: acyl-CoA dehydrogenase family protein [Bryobacteraceae bacterium]|nr:acyl-CoA dehydrogenase family protein [Bryobacteraceae bacterium]
MTTDQHYQTVLEKICSETISPNAPQADKTGAFPQASIQALKDAGLLGAISAAEAGGLALGAAGATRIVQRIARDCGSTAMVVCMHYCGTAVLEAHGSPEVRRAAAAGDHLSTLAFSEAGSRSHFWAPVSTARRDGAAVVLDARKSWVTSASRATAYVWSSKPLTAEGLSTLWLVPADAPGIRVSGPFDGLGLRGNDSSPVSAEGVRVPESAMLGEDGKGFDVMMGVVLPLFNVLNAACSVGLMEGAVERTARHAAEVRYQYSGSALAELPTIRNYIARMTVKTDMARALLFDTVAAIETGRADTMLRVLQCKAAAGEMATEVLDTAMRVCGGAAFRKDVGVERYFRDTRAAGVMAPTTDVLYDFIGKAACGLPLF